MFIKGVVYTTSKTNNTSFITARNWGIRARRTEVTNGAQRILRRIRAKIPLRTIDISRSTAGGCEVCHCCEQWHKIKDGILPLGNYSRCRRIKREIRDTTRNITFQKRYRFSLYDRFPRSNIYETQSTHPIGHGRQQNFVKPKEGYGLPVRVSKTQPPSIARYR